MTTTATEADRHREIAAIRSGLDHPIVDADGHLLESVPLLFEHVAELGGGAMVEKFAGALPGRRRSSSSTPHGPSAWQRPSTHSARATATSAACT